MTAALKFPTSTIDETQVCVPSRSADPSPMESVNEIKEQLSARSRTATLDQLASEGRRRVRLIRAEHVAQMIREAVHAAVEGSGLLEPAQVEALVAQSRQDFQAALREREQELEGARRKEAELEASERELADLKARFSELTQKLTTARAELQQAQDELDAARESQPSEQAAVSADQLTPLVQELAELKASIAHQQAASPPGPQGAADFEAAMNKLAGSLNERLDTFGKKMGVSAAVGGDNPVDLGGMFREDIDKDLESNMQNIQPKQKAAGGIAGNLAKLKKLKGGD